MRKILIAAAALAAVTAVGFGAHVTAQPYGGWGMMGGGYGPGMMQGWGPGYGPGPGWGMMGGYGPGPGWGMMGGWGPGRGMMGPWDGPPGNLNLSVNDVKTYLERWLAWRGNPRLKVGDVKEQDADTIVADIVTKDNSLVDRLIFNRHNGFYRRSEG